MPCVRRAEELEQLELLAVIGAGRIAVGRPDAAELLGDEILGRQLLLLAVAPVLARLRVEVLRERLGEPIGQRLDHDRVVVVVLLLEPARELVGADAGRHREHAEVVGHAALPRRDEVGQRPIRLRSSAMISCCRSIGKPRQLARGANRPRNTTMSSPTVLAGQKP